MTFCAPVAYANHQDDQLWGSLNKKAAAHHPDGAAHESEGS
jgi:hypothetical protein